MKIFGCWVVFLICIYWGEWVKVFFDLVLNNLNWFCVFVKVVWFFYIKDFYCWYYLKYDKNNCDLKLFCVIKNCKFRSVYFLV